MFEDPVVLVKITQTLMVTKQLTNFKKKKFFLEIFKELTACISQYLKIIKYFIEYSSWFIVGGHFTIRNRNVQ